jgi:hypothetical protein
MENTTILLLMLFSSVIGSYFREAISRDRELPIAEVTNQGAFHGLLNMRKQAFAACDGDADAFPFFMSDGFV